MESMLEAYERIINTINQSHYDGLVDESLLKNLEYMKKRIDSNDYFGAYHAYGTIIRKLVNINKPSDMK